MIAQPGNEDVDPDEDEGTDPLTIYLRGCPHRYYMSCNTTLVQFLLSLLCLLSPRVIKTARPLRFLCLSDTYLPSPSPLPRAESHQGPLFFVRFILFWIRVHCPLGRSPVIYSIYHCSYIH